MFVVVEKGKIFQYKFGDDGTSRSFILEIKWIPEYPEVLPEFSVDAFYNQHIIPSVKSKILDFAKNEGEQFLGMSMTFSIFEQIKENLTDLLSEQPEELEVIKDVSEKMENLEVEESSKNRESSPKKEHLTKAQKRRMWNQGGLASEDRPRGWNWVDVVRHLSQTGPAS